jgi:putative transcriptional regulator
MMILIRWMLLLAAAKVATSFTTTFLLQLQPMKRAVAAVAVATSVSAHKNLDRAHTELEFEHAMGDDWRLFRAKLVAQERSQQPKPRGRLFSTAQARLKNLVESWVSLLQQKRTGGLLARAIININIRAPSRTDDQSNCTTSISNIKLLSDQQDPFVSADELPIFITTYSPKVDKHRWAHPLSYIEPGCVLLASERLRPSNPFYKTAILVLQHDAETGTIGVILNKPLVGKTLLQMPESHIGLSQPAHDTEMSSTTTTSTNLDRSTQLAFWYAPVCDGGPMNSNHYTTLHGFGHVDGSFPVVPGVFCGGSAAFMEEGMTPDLVFIKGRTAWTRRQINRQLWRNQWHIVAVSSELLLQGTSTSTSTSTDRQMTHRNLWEDVLVCMGGKYADIAKKHNKTESNSRLAP